ncbi:MAG TPA: hypothetical protein VG245_04215 [Candidatus Dormibacteraeota bacterium]|jgi:hypothetical protein|nr:hypothetical protein [Candidatus Dormibacteraeota bacterium]
MARLMWCWKCGFRQPDTEITCPRCGAANAPGQSCATPPTVPSPRARELEAEYTRTHQRGRHVPGAVSLGVVLVGFVLLGLLYTAIFGH